MRGCSAASVLYDFEYRRFPRVCGDVPIAFPCTFSMILFSPRMRGCSAVNVLFHVFMHRFPRVCGDVPEIIPDAAEEITFSPRMRGCSLEVINLAGIE